MTPATGDRSSPTSRDGPRRPRRRALRGGASIAAAGLVASAAAAEGVTFEECGARFAARPDAYDSANCFFQVAQATKRWEDAARRLDALAARYPENLWLVLARGNVEWTRDVGRAEAFYRSAAEGFARRGHAEGEVLARYNLRTILFRRGRLDDAGREVERALAVAERSGAPPLLARALTLKATHLTDTGRDLGEAYLLLRRAEAAADAGAPYTLRRGILFALGNVCFQRGRFEEALEHYRQVEALTAEAGDTLTRATALYSLVNTRMRMLEELPRPGGRDEAVSLARAALQAAKDADNRETQVLVHRTLGELLGGVPGRRAEAAAHYSRCIELARAIGQPRELAHCLWSLGRHLAEDGRAEAARRRIEEALALARRTGHHWSLAHASRQRMRVSWRTRPRDVAAAESLDALDAIEVLRGLQDPEGGAEVFSAWARDYYWLAGRLLDAGHAPPPRADLARAFSVAERMRARALLDALAAAPGTQALPADHPLLSRGRALLQSIAETRRDLLAPGVGTEARRAALARLEALELEQEQVRRDLRALGPAAAAYAEPPLANLQDVEAALGADEALLSFLIGLREELSGEFGGGAWLTVSTRAGTRAYRLPDRVRLQAVVPVLLGLVERRDGRDAAAAARLYQELLGRPLAELPPGIGRLILVPDDALHYVPFAALRPAADREPLVGRFEIALAPSATLWLRWRTAGAPPAHRGALILADPTLPAAALPSGGMGAERFGTPLGPLPHAREEGEAVRRRLRGRRELWVGEAASERALKSAPLHEYGLVHFAAHAVVHDERAERSAVLLAAGGASEDGLLQVGEISELPLAGTAVVLSACRSARGAVLRGEGVIGLARGFFQAGAHAVVGSLWPVRDDDGARFVDLFYARLSRGAAVAAALRDAQREAWREGWPTAAWAGVVVMGDGGVRPVAAGSGGGERSLTALALAGLGLAAVLAWLAHERRAR